MEGIAYEYHIYLGIERDLFPEDGFPRGTHLWRWCKSRLFTQIKADVLGIPYVQLDRAEVGALGCAILGGYAVGIYPDMVEPAKRFTHVKCRIEPDMENHKRYQPYAEAYLRLSRMMEGVSDWRRKMMDNKTMEVAVLYAPGDLRIEK